MLSVLFVLFACDIRLTFSLFSSVTPIAGLAVEALEDQLVEGDTANDCWGHPASWSFQLKKRYHGYRISLIARLNGLGLRTSSVSSE